MAAQPFGQPEFHRRSAYMQIESERGEGGAHAFLAFTDRFIGQFHSVENLCSGSGQLDLNVHVPRLGPIECERRDSDSHPPTNLIHNNGLVFVR
jgi:hypothetical protein